MPDINEILKTAANNGASQYGAQMGRTNHCDGAPEALHLQKVRFVDGDYDTGGAYWGGGPGSSPLWCAFSPADTKNEEPIRIFVRASTRAEAESKVLTEVKEDGFTFLPDDSHEFFDAYVTAALWSSNDDNGEPLDAKYSVDDIAPETLAQMQADCAAFQETERASLAELGDATQNGHDFWFERSGSGAGFLDRDYKDKKAVFAAIEACEVYGSFDLYVGDDGKIYGQ